MRKSATILSAIAIASSAHANEDTNIAGAWAFQAEVQEGCEFSGTAQLRRSPTPGLYTCEMTARDFCQGNEAIVRQSCVVTRDGDKVNVQAFIEEFFLQPDSNYKPDNFRLIIDPDTGDMHGELDSYGIWKAVWKRTNGATS